MIISFIRKGKRAEEQDPPTQLRLFHLEKGMRGGGGMRKEERGDTFRRLETIQGPKIILLIIICVINIILTSLNPARTQVQQHIS